MPHLVALGLMVSDKKIFKDFQNFSVCCHGNQFLKESKYFKEHYCEISSKIGWVVSERMFKIKVNAWTDRSTGGHQAMT